MGFRMRNVIEGAVMGGIMALIALALPIREMGTRISVVTLFAAPFVILGAVGVNGDPVSGFLRNVYRWRKKREVLLYNGSTRFLGESPVDIAMEQKDLHDRIVEIMDERRRHVSESESGKTMIEGVDFEFAEDVDEKNAMASRNLVFEDEFEIDGDQAEGTPIIEAEFEISLDDAGEFEVPAEERG